MGRKIAADAAVQPEKRARLDAVVEGDDEDFDRAMEELKANAV